MLDSGVVSLQELTARFCHQCPDGYFVTFKGAAVRNRPDGPVFLVEHGQLLQAEYVRDHYMDEPPPSLDTDDYGPSDGAGAAGDLPPDPNTGPPAARNRSRSPRPGPHATGDNAPPGGTQTAGPCRSDQALADTPADSLLASPGTMAGVPYPASSGLPSWDTNRIPGAGVHTSFLRTNRCFSNGRCG